LGDKESATKIAGLLNDPHFAVRVRAVEVLGTLNVPATGPALQKATSDPYYQVRYGAQRALDAK
jgi:HEAT repeat protein